MSRCLMITGDTSKESLQAAFEAGVDGRKKREKDLEEALDQVKALKGMLPICASCKKIRKDDGYWQQIESYIRDHSEAEFSHSICPECAKRLYPDLDIYKEIR